MDHGLNFGYDENGKWKEEIFGRIREFSVPLSFDMVRAKSVQVPAELYRMYYMNLKDGSTGYANYDSNKRAGNNQASSEYDDEERFFVEISKPFVYNPETNTITVVPEEGIFNYEGTMTITWKQPDITYNSKPLSKTFEVTWVDPDGGYCLVFDSKGGTPIKTQVLGKDKPVKEVEDPVKIGYEFGGWYADEAYTQPMEVPATMPNHDLTLHAKWIPIPNQYTVCHCYENLVGVFAPEESILQEYLYTKDASKKVRVYTDDIVTRERVLEDNVKLKYGFELDYDRMKDQVQVKPDGSAEYYIYYKRQIHSVTYTMGELKDEDNPDVVVKYRYEDLIYDPELYVYGYSFKGWSPELAVTMDIADLKYDALWEGAPNTPYYLEYYIKYPTSEQYVMLGGQSGKLYKEGTAGAEVKVSDYLLTEGGYRFVKATVKGVETDENGSGKIEPRGKLVIRYYYEALPFALHFDPKGGTLVNTPPTQYVYGVPLNFENVLAKKTGYEFLGWFDGEDCMEALTAVPRYRSGDMTLIAKWERTTHNITLYDTDKTTKLGAVTAGYDELLPALTKLPEKAGFDFNGFYAEDGACYYDEKGRGQIIWKETNGISLYAKWTPKKVEIGLDANGGSVEATALLGTYLEKYPTLPVPTKTGYTFLGWTIEGAAAGSYVTDETAIANYETHTLTALWKASDDTRYTVECYVRTGEEGEEAVYELRTSFTALGTTDAEVAVDKSSYSIPGYTFIPSVEGSVLSAVVAPDGSTVLKMYFNKGVYYEVTYDYGPDIPAQTIMVADNEKLQLPYALPENETHYALSYWKLDNTAYKPGSEYGYIQENMKFTAVLKKDGYTVSYNSNIFRNEIFLDQQLECDTSYQVMGNLFTNNTAAENGSYYEFAGWNTESDGSGTAYQPGDALLNLSDGGNRVVLFAQWQLKPLPENMVPYYVDYVYRYDGNSGVNTYTVRKFGKAGEQTRADEYALVDTELISCENKTISEAGDTVVTVTYQKNQHSVTLDFAGGTFNGKTGAKAEGFYEYEYFVETLDLGVSSVDEIIPVKPGYEFVGWNVDVPSFYMTGYEVSAIAQYRRTGLYQVTVNYYLETADGTDYVLDSTETYYQEIGDFAPVPSAVAGFVTPEKQTITVADNNDNVVEYRYARQEYTLSWDAGEGTLSEGTYTSGKVKYGAEITAPGLSRAGYTGTWADFGGTMPARDVTYEPEWTPEMVEYHIMYRYRESAEEPNLSTLFSVRKTALTGSVAQTSAEIPEGSNYDEYRAKITEEYEPGVTSMDYVNGDGSTIIYVDFELKKYRVNFLFGKDVELTQPSLDTSGVYAYGKTIQMPPMPVIKRTGYTPVGWYHAEDENETIIEEQFLEVKEDATYLLKWEPVEYSITYDLQLPQAENSNHNWTRYHTGFDFNIAGAVCENYGFVRWEWAGKGELPEGVELLENGLVHVSENSAGDLSFRAVWEENTKLFTARLYEGSDELYHVSYPATKDITLGEIEKPTREGYVCVGWEKKVPSEAYGFYPVRIPEDTPVSTLNYNTDYVTAVWLKLDWDGAGYNIHVASEQDCRDAVRFVDSYPGTEHYYWFFVVDKNIQLTSPDTPLFESIKQRWVLLGDEHKIWFTGTRTAPVIGENWGSINEVKLEGAFDHTNGEDTYFGALVNKNYGRINWVELKNCYVRGAAAYVGGIAGYNYREIRSCSVVSSDISYNCHLAKGDGVVGGIVGFNDHFGKLKGDQVIESHVGSYAISGQTVYVGGLAGQNDGAIGFGGVSKSTIGTDTKYSEKSGTLIVGGVVGFDRKERDPKVQIDSGSIGIVTMEDTLVVSPNHAGGIFGICNYSIFTSCHLNNLTVESDRGYAGLVAGIYNANKGCAVDGVDYYSYVSNGKVLLNEKTGTSNASVIAGYHDYQFAFCSLRSLDETRVYNGMTHEKKYPKGQFWSKKITFMPFVTFVDVNDMTSGRW